VLWRRSMGYLEALPEAPRPNPLGEGWGALNEAALRPTQTRGRGEGGRRHVLGGRRSPPQERGTPVKTGAKCREQTQVAPLNATFLERFVQKNGY
jgi:hypothetical protein